MFRIFSGGMSEDGWPLEKVIAGLESQYGALQHLGEDGQLAAYGVQQNGVNFIVALMQTAEGSGRLAEM